jgi:hypothetical protein
VALVAPGAQVVQIETQIAALLDGYLVISVQVAFVAGIGPAQFLEDYRYWRQINASLSTLPDDLWLPAAIHTAPSVSFEAMNAQTNVMPIIATFRRLAAHLFPHSRVRLAAAGFDQLAASGGCAGT